MANQVLFEGAGSQSSKITMGNQNGFVELLNPLSLLQTRIDAVNALYHYDVTFRIEGFRLLINITSLPVAPFPDIFPEDSQATRNNKLMQTEFQNPNIIFRMFKTQNNTDYELGDVYLQNKGTQYCKSLMRPYLIDGNIPIKLWDVNSVLKCKLFNSGNGLLSELNTDYLQIELDYSYTISGAEKSGVGLINPLNFAKTIRTGTPQLILPTNLKRIKLSFKNEGDSSITFAFGTIDQCVIGAAPELKPGQTFNDESRYPYQQSLFAVAHEESILVSGLEGSLL